MKLLVVDDDPLFSKALTDCLRTRYVTEHAATLREARLQLELSIFDLIILDYELPDGTAESFCHELRNSNIAQPILILTGHTDIEKLEKTLNAGADDHITKPFNPTEVFARINALLRRPAVPLPTSYTLGNLTINPNDYSVYHRSTEIHLRQKEFILLEILMRNPGKIISRTELWEKLWSSDTETFSNALEVHVCRLRNKLKDVPDIQITTTPNRGYAIEIR